MTIFKTAYDTTSHHGYQTKKSQDALKAATAMGALQQVGGGMFILKDGDNYRNAVPGFVHPLAFESVYPMDPNQPLSLAVDVRPFGAWSKTQDDFIVRNPGEVKFALLRMRLNHVWLNENPNYLRNVSPVPIKMYANWIAQSLSNRFMLEPLSKMKLNILAGIFYYSLFSNDKELSHDERVRVAGALSRDLNIVQSDVLDVLDQYPVINSLTEFCAVAAEACQAVQLQELSTGLLISALGGSWFGVGYKEVLAAALEHPPTWIAICYTAGNDRSYRNTNIFRIFEHQASRGADQLFFNSLTKLLSNMAPVEA